MVTGMPDPDANHRFGDVRRVDEIDSTNTALLAEARAGAAEGVVLVADHQTAGRGRLGRAWSAPPGASLLVSVLLRPTISVDDVHLCSLAVALAAVDACTDVAGIRPLLKWPNDLVVEEPDGPTRKLAGILAESHVEGRRLAALVVGMGLNVNWPDDLPEELADIAVSLNHLAGRPIDRDRLLECFLAELEDRYAALATEEGREAIRDDYLRACATFGRHVRVDLADGAVTGTATGISTHGHLIVDGDDGARREITAGDLVHLRPA